MAHDVVWSDTYICKHIHTYIHSRIGVCVGIPLWYWFRARYACIMRQGLQKRPKVPFAQKYPSDKYPCSSPEAIDLLEKLLAFDPDKRLTVEEVLTCNVRLFGEYTYTHTCIHMHIHTYTHIQATHTATCKINGNRSDGVPVANWYKAAVEKRWRFPFILQVAVHKQVRAYTHRHNHAKAFSSDRLRTLEVLCSYDTYIPVSYKT